MQRHKIEYWAQVEKYYDRVERSNGRFQNWTSEETKQNRWGLLLGHSGLLNAQSLNSNYVYTTLTFSLDLYQKARMNEERQQHLQMRREKLRQLLESESRQYEEEMRAAARAGAGGERDQGGLVDLRLAREELRKEREAEQKREAEEKMMQHWKINNPEFREVRMGKALLTTKICLTRSPFLLL